ncbi:hypothetical protein M3231_16150 [Neobacillus mesonae]|nr:hypothetical protein [Neobacillus mesonae]
MKLVFSLIGSIMTILGLYLFSYNWFSGNYISNPTNENPGSFPNASYFITGFYIFPLLCLVFFILYMIFYKKINIRGIVLSGMVGFWLFSLLTTISSSPIYYYLPLIVIVLGAFLVRFKGSGQAMNWTLAGTAAGWLIAYLIVIALRAIQNSLTSYFYFDPSQKIFVLAMILVFGIAGWLIGRKKNQNRMKF